MPLLETRSLAESNESNELANLIPRTQMSSVWVRSKSGVSSGYHDVTVVCSLQLKA